MMLIAICCWTLLLSGAGAELLIAVTPEIVEPDVTPFFTLRCSLAEQEEGNIAALALYRKSITAKAGNTSPQLVAEILGTTPSTPSLVPGFEGLTVHGQISQLEAELETYLEIVWPNPSVADLGLYSCEVTVLGEAGGVTTLVETRVTTSNAVTDRLLAAVVALQGELGVFNQSLEEIRAEIDNITAVLDTEIRPAVESRGAEKPVYYTTVAVPSAITPVEGTPAEETTLSGESETPEEETQPSVVYELDLNRIAEGLDELKNRLENINDTLVRIDVVITSLTERAAEERETTTDQAAEEIETTTGQAAEEIETTTGQDTIAGEVILTNFESSNSSYLLFKASNNTDTRRAQVVCESKELYLAEINDQTEFQSIANAIDSYLNNSDHALVAGERQSGQKDFIFQNSQAVVQFFTWDFRSDVDYPNGTCLALQQSTNGLTLTTVPCSSDDEINAYFLCEREQF